MGLNNKIVPLMLSLMLLWALADNPYVYYQILRLLTCGYSAYASLQHFSKDKSIWGWIFATIAIVFNPFIPLRFDKDIWSVLDLATASILLVNIITSINIKLPRFQKPTLKSVLDILTKIGIVCYVVYLVAIYGYMFLFIHNDNKQRNIEKNMNFHIS